MTKIAVVGYFGWGNFGDQLFLDTVLRRREELWPGSPTVIPMTTKDLAPHATIGPLGALLRALHTVRIARGADLLAYCGGSVFGGVSGVDALRRRLRPARAQALGVSVGPFSDPSAQAAVKNYLADFERIVVRDDSWRLLHDTLPADAEPADASSPRTSVAQLPLEQGGDLAALSPLITQVPADERDGLLVCPSAAAGGTIDTLSAQVMQARSALVSRGRSPRVRLLALNGHPRHGDFELIRALASSLRARGVACTTSNFLELGLEATVTALSSADLVLSQRLHGAIVAYLSGGRFVMIDHHPKCRAFVEDVTGAARVSVPVEATDVSAALEAALDPAAPFSRRPQDYIEHAHRVYTEQLAHA